MAKGSQFERELARFLTQWLSNQKKELYFWRSPSSGAVATVSSQDIAGDIMAVKPEAYILTKVWNIEAKNGYPKASFDKHLKETKGDIIKDFWIQCVRDAQSCNPIKKPMLIFKKKGLKPIIGISSIDCPIIDKIKYDKIHMKNITEELNCLILHWKDIDTYGTTFFDMKQFFEYFTPEVAEKLYQDYIK